MIGDQKTKDDGFVSVATKVPPHVAELLSILARMRGMEVYQLLQLLIHGFISYARAEQDVPTEFRNLYESLKFDTAWNKAFNFASPTVTNEVAQLLLVLQQRDPQGNINYGFGLKLISKPFMSDAHMTGSHPEIFERVCELCLGQKDYLDLRKVNTFLRSPSTLDTMRTMIDAQIIAHLDEMDKIELPGMGNYHDYGREIEYGNIYRRHQHRTPDSVAQQQTIRFDEEDATTTDTPDTRPYCEKADAYLADLEERARQEEADYQEGELGFRPFDQEY